MKTAEFLFENATMALRRNRKDDALEVLTEVLRLQPTHADAWAMRARLEAEKGRPFNAMLHHGFAIQLQPERYDFWCNRGIDAMSARMFKESKESFEKSLKIQETYEAHFNYGNLLSELMDIDGAVEQFEAAEKLGGPQQPQIHANLGVAMIAQGKWREGFQRYRHRFNAMGFPPRPRFMHPIWHGEPLDGKTILLYVEQGFGDEIMSYRFASVVKELGARVILSVRPPLFRLARSLEKVVDAVIMQYDDPPWKPDCMSALLDVPAYIDFAPERGLPGSEGYLKAEDREFDLTFPDPIKVGICWASGRRELQPEVLDVWKKKTLALEEFLPLRRDGVTLVSLQKEHNNTVTLRDNSIFDPMVGNTDFADTAWVINQLDLVITVDTAVAHLAGALGKPVWNLVRFDALWPWGKPSETTHWYDSMRLYRQDSPLDWKPPIKRLLADFDQWVMERQAKAA